MIVLKFGGTSVSTKENLSSVLHIIKETSRKDDLMVVVSAFSQITNQLTHIAHLAQDGDPEYEKKLNEVKSYHNNKISELFPQHNRAPVESTVKGLLHELSDICRGIFLIQECSPKTMDMVLSYGEQLSSTILEAFFIEAGQLISLVDPTTFIKTDDGHGNASVDFEETYRLIQEQFEGIEGNFLCPGYLASTADGTQTTLGRGGSDLTASLIAAAMNAQVLEIWTDVSGMMTANPKMVPLAHPIAELSYEEAMELSHFGAKVLYPPTVQPVMEKQIPIRIKNTLKPEEAGTHIHADMPEEDDDDKIVTGISNISNIALITLSGSGMIAIPKFSFRLFEALSEAEINVILITQSSSEHTISVAIKAEDHIAAKRHIDAAFDYEIKTHKVNPLEVELDLAIIGVVGRNMKKQIGVSANLFEALSDNGINVKAIAQGSTELNISVVIPEEDLPKALNSIHGAFFLSDTVKINLFMIGVGNVGQAFIKQVMEQNEYLREKYHLELRFIGLSNSQVMVFEDEGISLSKWGQKLQQSNTKADISSFVMKMIMMNKANSIFIDATANDHIPEHYPTILKKSISIVTPNKVASSSSMANYNELKELEKKYQCKFLYEANVGAGLPIISTIQDMKKSGDKIHSIEAVLSGTLNYIFNTYNGEVPFVSIVKKAKEMGYSEPDPRIDLSGKDVARKLLILGREIGHDLEFKDIQMTTFLPKSCLMAPNLDKFYKELMNEEEYFKDLFESANSRHKRLRYVASWKNDIANIKLEMIPEGHPLYHIEASDNIILIYSKRYHEQPLVVKGAGAGADVTAAGIFADVMRIASR